MRAGRPLHHLGPGRIGRDEIGQRSELHLVRHRIADKLDDIACALANDGRADQLAFLQDELAFALGLALCDGAVILVERKARDLDLVAEPLARFVFGEADLGDFRSRVGDRRERQRG